MAGCTRITRLACVFLILELSGCGRTPTSPVARASGVHSVVTLPPASSSEPDAPERVPVVSKRAPAIAAGGPLRDQDDLLPPSAGSLLHLPVGGYAWFVLVDHALNHMPGVKTAMDEFARRGYVRHAERDTAFSTANPQVSFVQFIYERPGLPLPASQAGWAVIWVLTRVDPNTRSITTNITAGIVVLDALTRRLFPGDSLAGIAASDPAFDVLPGGGGGPDSQDRRPVIRPANAFNTAPGKSKLDAWLTCMEWSGVGCSTAVFTASVIAGIFTMGIATPGVAVTSFLVCMLFSAIACIASG